MSENPSQAMDLKPPPGEKSDDALGGGDAQMNHPDHGADTGVARAMDEDRDGAVEGEGMEEDRRAGPGYPADQHGVITPHLGGNQLTLSFQGEVFVFESVSPEKVQAVLLLLGGREISTTPFASSSLTPSRRANFPHRIASLMRFREKRKERNFDKKIRYDVRKDVALRMQRNKGQFISSKSKPEDATLGAGWEAAQGWGSAEDRSQAASECHHCGISSKSTPMMRRGPDGPRTLCNACGLMWANKGMMRDLSKSPSAPIQNPMSDPKAGGIIIDLSRNPSPPIHNASSELKEGKNTSEAGAVQPLAITANGHDSS